VSEGNVIVWAEFDSVYVLFANPSGRTVSGVTVWLVAC
jgi:hypothetical protein